MGTKRRQSSVAPVSRGILRTADEIGDRATRGLEELRRRRKAAKRPPAGDASADHFPTVEPKS